MAQGGPAAATGTLDVGPLADYKDDKVYDKFATKTDQTLVVRKDGKVYAISARCTHRNCTVKVDKAGYYCPCHKSHFTPEGMVEKGPAKASLFRYAIATNDKGDVIVDRAKQFSEKDWEKDGAFIEVKK